MNNKISSLIFSLAAFSSTTLADTSAILASSSKSTFDWTGIYVGGFMGGATGSDVSNTPSFDTVERGWWTGSTANDYSTKAGFIGGGTVGYNWQIGKTPYLVGIEGEYGYLSQQNSKTDPNAATWSTDHSNLTPDNSQSSTSIGADYGYGLIGGRLGYALDRSLIYVKSGAVFTTVNSSWSDAAWDFNGTSNKATTTGYALGAGFEYALPFKHLTNVTVKTEYLYFGIPTSSTINAEDYVITTQTTGGIHTAG